MGVLRLTLEVTLVLLHRDVLTHVQQMAGLGLLAGEAQTSIQGLQI